MNAIYATPERITVWRWNRGELARVGVAIPIAISVAIDIILVFARFVQQETNSGMIVNDSQCVRNHTFGRGLSTNNKHNLSRKIGHDTRFAGKQHRGSIG